MPGETRFREQELFCDCLDLPPGERGLWLDEACGQDRALRERMARLLEAHDLAERSGVPEGSPESPDLLPEQFDGYRILRLIGEGGMGVVYEALQEEPVRRRVALKAIKPGMDTRRVIGRFRAELQALAAMDHPYVAKVFDAGQTPSGRPYFVMEYVDGMPLHQYCERHGFSVPERIDLFVLICQAVQHAHHKGVIHRDLKPANILVASEGERPMPKIIDFGIARAVTPEHREPLTQTIAGLRAGTPAYMSPEQAGRAGLDVDTRSDVYSLGVILYELLTGCLPADPEQVPAAEFLHGIAQGDLKIALPSVRAGGSTGALGLRKQLAGDLDWIVMKALETDRERRYETANALADDLQRHRTGKPVAARPPTLGYRTGKFVRRYKVPVAAAVIAVAAIVAGGVAGGLGLVRARRAEGAAKQEAAAARQVSNFLVRLFTTSDPNAVPGSPVTVRQVLEEGTRRVETELTGLPEAQATLLGTLSHVHQSIGSYRQSKALAERALTARPSAADVETAEILESLSRANQRLGELDAARKAAQRALDIRVRLLGENHPDVGRALNLLGAIDGQVENFGDAVAAHRRALAIQERAGGPNHIATYNSWRGLGMVYDRQGNYPAALDCFRQVLPIARQRYGESHPVVADALQNVAMVLRELKQVREAQNLFEEALRMRRKLLGPNHPSVAFSAHGLAQTLRDQGRLKEAMALLEESIRIRTAALGAENLRTGESLKNLGLVRIGLGQFGEGRRQLLQAIRILEKAYGPDHTDVLECHRDAARALAEAGRYADAIPHLRKVVSAKVPARVRVDLRDPVFDRMRGSRAFRELEGETAAAVPR